MSLQSRTSLCARIPARRVVLDSQPAGERTYTLCQKWHFVHIRSPAGPSSTAWCRRMRAQGAVLLNKLLGEGAYGCVNLVIVPVAGPPFALKIAKRGRVGRQQGVHGAVRERT